MTNSTFPQLKSNNFVQLIASARAEGVQSAIKCMNDDEDIRKDGVQPFPWQVSRLRMLHEFTDRIERETSVVAEMRAWEDGFDSTIQNVVDSSAKALESKASELQTLRNTIEDMDALSHSSFSKILTIASLASASLEAALAKGDLTDIWSALSIINQDALEGMDCINVEADKVGCKHARDHSYREKLVMRNRAAESRAA